jgi:hypothetical protein
MQEPGAPLFRYRLRNGDFRFFDLLGSYSLINMFAESAGKKEATFTPT